MLLSYRQQNCLGALDGTYIKLNVLQADKARYRTRKGEIEPNALRVCSQDIQFIYIFFGWEGFATNFKVIRERYNDLFSIVVSNQVCI